jgi:hypothetical protein
VLIYQNAGLTTLNLDYIKKDQSPSESDSRSASQEIPAFHGTRMSITVFTRASDYPFFSINSSIKCLPSHCIRMFAAVKHLNN